MLKIEVKRVLNIGLDLVDSRETLSSFFFQFFPDKQSRRPFKISANFSDVGINPFFILSEQNWLQVRKHYSMKAIFFSQKTQKIQLSINLCFFFF